MTKNLLSEKFEIVKSNKLVFNDAFYINKTLQETSFNLIIDIDNKRSKSETCFLVRVTFEDNTNNEPLNSNGLKHTDELGWHFYVDVPDNKKVETSYAFVCYFIGSAFLEIDCLDEDSQLIINSIEIEILKN